MHLPLSYFNSDVLLLFFSIDNPNSLTSISKIWALEVKYVCPTTPLMLLGNKKDLRKDEETIAKLTKVKCKPVSTQEGLAVAEEIGAIAYLECSACNTDVVWQLIETAL